MTSKIAVSLPDHLVEHARRAVAGGQAPSVSAYVAAAMEEKAKLDELAGWLAELLTETGGPMTEAEADWADDVLGR